MVKLLDSFSRKLKGWWWHRITFPAMRKEMKYCGENVQIEKIRI